MPAKTKRELAEELLIEAKKREIQGLTTYGDFVPKEDTRILSYEAIEEVLDAWVYIGFYRRKYPESAPRTDGIRALLLSTYISLRRLEEEERTHNKGGDLSDQ